ncbi:MAG: DNA-directed RNA polymerase subunit beta [Aerococcus sp.]|nr:DNA-directed RNA polymerase subunit beta [Aerococcus sp.]
MATQSLGRRFLHLIGRLVLVVLILVILFAIGLMVGYGVSGGDPFWAIFSPEKWQHLFSFLPI